MIGFNSRETFQDATYDVQTQELTGPARLIETHVYRNGKIVATVRCDIREDLPVSSLEQSMSRQHEEICGRVREGTYELVFLWLSRGIIAFEAQDYIQALECFESVLSIEETHAEANAYLGKLQDALRKDARNRRRVLEGYEHQIEALESSNRIMEAARKRAILTRICKPPSSPTLRPGAGNMGAGARSRRTTLLQRRLAIICGTLVSAVRERRFTRILHGKLPARIRQEWLPAIRESIIPAIRESLLPKIRENLFSKYLLVTFSAAVLMVLSGLISADFQLKLDPAYHSALGMEYLKANRIVPARNLFYRILRQDPASQVALDGFWETFSRQGNFGKAADMLEALTAGQSGESAPQICFYLAEACRRSSKCADAIPHYEAALKGGYPEVPAKIGMGLCLIEQGDVTGAINLWEDLLRKGFDDYRLDYCLGMAYQAKGRLGRAAVHYSRALQKHPDSGPIYRVLGDCLYGLHQQKKAETLWKKAASLASAESMEEHCPNTSKSAEGGGRASLPCFPFPLI